MLGKIYKSALTVFVGLTVSGYTGVPLFPWILFGEDCFSKFKKEPFSFTIYRTKYF